MCDKDKGLICIGTIDREALKSNEQQRRVYSIEGCSPCITTDSGGGNIPKVSNIECTDEGWVRVHTERECFRLMGVKDEDFDKIAKNQSRSSLYHLAGDSIVTNCLMGIYLNLLGGEENEQNQDITRR